MFVFHERNKKNFCDFKEIHCKFGQYSVKYRCSRGEGKRNDF